MGIMIKDPDDPFDLNCSPTLFLITVDQFTIENNVVPKTTMFYLSRLEVFLLQNDGTDGDDHAL